MFGTKSETLEMLAGRLRAFTVLPQVRCSVGEWHDSRDACIERIQALASKTVTNVIVRSSARNEDTELTSNAGRYRSVPNVLLASPTALTEAIDSVVASLGASPDREDQFFVQPFVDTVSMSGVVFTREMETLAPYYVINYDGRTGRTDTVTSGTGVDTRTAVVFRGARRWPDAFERLLVAVTELEKVLGTEALDIEFATDADGVPILLQVRPITRNKRVASGEERHAYYLNKIAKKIAKLQRPHPYLHGSYTILGVMPDWNPAEIIGIRPRPLALSLYKYLVTDRTWAYQRHNYGYSDVRSFPLLVSLVGLPYIDVRVSFNSFVPKGLTDALSEKLVCHYLDRLRDHRELHDKVEFDIVLSCYSMDIDDRLDQLRQAGFSAVETHELRQALLGLTDAIMTPGTGVLNTDLARIESLRHRQEKVLNSQLSDLEKIYWLLEDCCRYGTLPFAGIARAAFVAVQMLRSMVARGLIEESDMEQFMLSLRTVSKQMAVDCGNLNRDDFLAIYGHLRPGTYDLLSARYDEAYETYFSGTGNAQTRTITSYRFPKPVLDRLDQILRKEGFTSRTSDLVGFLVKAIEGREYAKFVFSRSISEVLRLVTALAEKYELAREDASFLDIKTFIDLYASLDHRDLTDILREEADRNRIHFRTTSTIRLPSLIVAPDDIYAFELEPGKPNFITTKRCRCAVVPEEEILTRPLEDTFVCIRNADPGYDWLFARGIAGLLTMYGGTNSHMAIRAAEQGIPAIIGAGEKLYSTWSQAGVLDVDCENRQVRVLR